MRYLGFGKFDWKTLGLGCGLVVASYAVILLFNTLLTLFGITTQGEEIVKIFGELNTPVWFLIAGTMIAPFVEEIFFRGFLFQGLRQRYGWVNGMLLSSAIFAIAHLDPGCSGAHLHPGECAGVCLSPVEFGVARDHAAFSGQCIRGMRRLLCGALSKLDPVLIPPGSQFRLFSSQFNCEPNVVCIWRLDLAIQPSINILVRTGRPEFYSLVISLIWLS